MVNFLPANISMGAVTLRVANLDLITDFYTRGVGLTVIQELPSSRILSGTNSASLILEHMPQLKHAGPSEAGLFHSAFLFESQAQLSAAVASVAAKFPNSFTGSADHLVSEAFYFNDPEGNGVELYFDRPRSAWAWEQGQVQMDTLALDPNLYLATHGVEGNGIPSKIGHVHLSIGDIARAKDFYVDKLGFEITMNWGQSALFVAAGGYHHHMAMNIWRSRGAGYRQQVLGLGDVAIELPDSEALGALHERLTHFGIELKPRPDGFSTEDPWGNQVSLSAQTLGV